MSKIIIFSAFYDPFISGAERMVKEVTLRLQDRYCFIIITARLSRKLASVEEVESPRFEPEARVAPAAALRARNLGKFDLDNGRIKIVRIGLGYKFDKFLYPILAPFYALKYRPKIVHAVMESYAGIALLLYCHLMKLSFVLRLRQKLSFEKAFCILTLQSGDLDLPEKQARIPQWLWKRIHRAPDLVVSIGNSMAERARRLGATNVRVIPNGVDLQKVKEVEHLVVPEAPSIGPEAPWALRAQHMVRARLSRRIICVARLSPEKGIEYLLDAMPEILKEFSDVKLVLVGEGLLRKSLEFRISNFEFPAREAIKIVGTLSHEKTLQEISASEILVLPSLAEGMGIVLVEAQALGVPVIGTNVGGIPDVIEHEKTGLLVPPRDSRAIAKAVILLLRDRELRERIVEEAKTRLARFDWQTIAEQYSKIYESRIMN